MRLEGGRWGVGFGCLEKRIPGKMAQKELDVEALCLSEMKGFMLLIFLLTLLASVTRQTWLSIGLSHQEWISFLLCLSPFRNAGRQAPR